MNMATLDPFVESCVEAFEKARQEDRQGPIEQFAPAKDHPRYLDVITELARVSLDLSWDHGEPQQLESFRLRFPEIFASQAHREALAFEEFRLRRQAGEQVTAHEYRDALGIENSHWLQWEGYDVADRGELNRDEGSANRRLDGTFGSTKGRFGSTTVDTPAPAMRSSRPAPGKTWGGFEIERSLGVGSFGEAFLARQSTLAGRHVVLKVSEFESAEAENIAKLQHTNIVPVFSAHAAFGQTVLCMPYMGSCTFAGLIRELAAVHTPWGLPPSGSWLIRFLDADSSMSSLGREQSAARHFFATHSFAESILWLVARLADGLQHAHERGILHRDIKPANILLRADGEPLLIDFNLATDQFSHGGETLGGTLPYMSPEQLAAFRSSTEDETEIVGKRVDSGSDVYSLGVCLFELLTGELPFPPTQEVTSGQTCSQVESGTVVCRPRRLSPREITRRYADITPAVAAMIAKALDPDPALRYATAAAFRDDLQSHLDDLPLTHAANPSRIELIRKWTRRHPKLASGTNAALVICLAVACMLGAWRMRENELVGIRATGELQRVTSELDRLLPTLAAVGLEASDSTSAVQEAETLAKSMPLTTDASDNDHWAAMTPSQQSQWRQVARTLGFLLARSHESAAVIASSLAERQRHFDEALCWTTVTQRWLKENDALLTSLERRIKSRESVAFMNVPEGNSPPEARLPTVVSREKVDAAKQVRDKTTNSTPAIIVPHDKASALDWLIVGLEFVTQDRLSEAADAFRQATSLAPHDPAGWLRLADVCRKQGQLSRSLAYFDICVRQLPDSAFVVFQRGLCHLEANEPIAAVSDFSRAIELAPHLASAYLNRAVANLALGSSEPALEDLSHVIEQGSDDPRVYLLRARVYQQLGQFEAARNDRRVGIDRDAVDELGYLAKGVALLPDQPAKALAEFQKALAKNPKSSAAMHNMAHVLSEKMGQNEAAIEVLAKAVDLDENDVMARAGRGVLLGRENRFEEALADASVLEQLSLDAITKYQLACIYALATPHDQSYTRRAIGRLLEGVQQDPKLLREIAADPDLDSLKSNTEWMEALDACRSVQRSIGLANRNATR